MLYVCSVQQDLKTVSEWDFLGRPCGLREPKDCNKLQFVIEHMTYWMGDGDGLSKNQFIL